MVSRNTVGESGARSLALREAPAGGLAVQRHKRPAPSEQKDLRLFVK
jgi:hypothetical protein